MKLRFVILSIAVCACLIPPALGTKILAAKALAIKGAALKGAAKLAIKGAAVAGAAALGVKAVKAVAAAKSKLLTHHVHAPVPVVSVPPPAVKYQYSYPVYHVHKIPVYAPAPVVTTATPSGGVIDHLLGLAKTVKSSILKKASTAEELAYAVHTAKHKKFQDALSAVQNHELLKR